MKGWSEANPRVVSPRGKCCNGRNHSSTALSGGRGNHGGGGRSNYGHVTAVGAATGSAAAGGGAVLEQPVGREEERRTRGRKALPPRVFAILTLEKEKKREGGGGGGGGEVIERSWPINSLIKWLERKDRKINGGHRKRRVCRRRKVREINSGPVNFHRLRKITQPIKFPAKKKPIPNPLRHL